MNLNKNINSVVEESWSISKMIGSGVGKSIVFSRGHNFRTIYETHRISKIEMSCGKNFVIGLYNISGDLMGTIGGNYAKELFEKLRYMSGSGGKRVAIGWLNYARSFWAHSVKSTSDFYHSYRKSI